MSSHLSKVFAELGLRAAFEPIAPEGPAAADSLLERISDLETELGIATDAEGEDHDEN